MLGSPQGYVGSRRHRERCAVARTMHETPYVVDGTLVYVDDVDAHAVQARRAGAEILSEPADQPHGDRIYRVEDSEGHRWMFATHLRDTEPEECRRHLGRRRGLDGARPRGHTASRARTVTGRSSRRATTTLADAPAVGSGVSFTCPAGDAAAAGSESELAVSGSATSGVVPRREAGGGSWFSRYPFVRR